MKQPFHHKRPVITLLLGCALGASAQTASEVGDLEQQISSAHANLAQAKGTTDIRNLPFINPFADPSRLQVGALVEWEAFHADTDGDSDGDTSLATVAVIVDANLMTGVNAHVGFLWENDFSEHDNIDEAYLIFGQTENNPFALTVGKLYLPFGNLSTAFVSDPLTLELAEINETAAILSYGNDFVQVFTGVFDGDINNASSFESLFSSISITPIPELEIGGYWISNLYETDGLEGFADTMGTNPKQSGAGCFLNAQCGCITLNAEFVTALGDVDAGDQNVTPSAFNLEASAPITDQLTFGAKFEGSDEFYGDVGADKFADEQYGVVLSYAMNDYVTLATEYMHSEGLDDGASSDLGTVQLSLAF